MSSALVFCCVKVCSDKNSRTADVSKGPAASIMRFHSDYEGRGFLWKADNFLPGCRTEGSHLYAITAKDYKIVFYHLNSQVALT